MPTRESKCKNERMREEEEKERKRERRHKINIALDTLILPFTKERLVRVGEGGRKESTVTGVPRI